MKIHPNQNLSIALRTLRVSLDAFEYSLECDAAALKHVDSIRIDGEVTRLVVDLTKEEIYARMALASEAVINLKALLHIAGRLK